MRIIDEEQLDFDDLLIQPKRSTINSRADVSLIRQFKWQNNETGEKFNIEFIPVGTSNMGTIGTTEFAKKMVLSGHFACLEKHISFDNINQLFVELQSLATNLAYDNTFYTDKIVISIGIREKLNELKMLYDRWHLKMIRIDAPNGYIPSLKERIKEIRNYCKDSFIIAGNVVTATGAEDLILAGANAVSTGIGNGACCRTRVKTGVGRPQASALIEIADTVHQLGMYCLCDGGCATSGDICKAFGCGADMVISGSLFAATYDAEGEVIYKNNKPHKAYYGMSSHLAQEKHFGGIRNYSASEGIEKLIPITGTLDDVLQDIDGGLKSCMTYIGATQMKNFSKHTTFYKVHRQFNDIFEHCENIS